MRAVAAIAAFCGVGVASTPFEHRIDHQFRGPGDVQFGVFDSRFNDPELLKLFNYTAQAGRYAETALTFDALRPADNPFFPVGSPERAWINGHGDAIRAEQNATAAAGITVMSHIDFPILPRKVLAAYADKICLNGTVQRCEANFTALVTVLDVMMTEMFNTFPLLDGIIVRTGEHCAFCVCWVFVAILCDLTTGWHGMACVCVRAHARVCACLGRRRGPSVSPGRRNPCIWPCGNLELVP